MGQLSNDLRSAFPETTGFSKRNLELVRQWRMFYSSCFAGITKQFVSQMENRKSEIAKQVVSQTESIDFDVFVSIPWGHHILIIQKIKNSEEALFYVSKTLENNWSRSVLGYQIETQLYQRQGKAINNFKNVLPETQGDLAKALLKDPYNFDFVALSERAHEKDLEKKLVQHISEFLLELGKGFAYMGRQFSLKVGSKEYRTDLLFYHTKLKCYIVIELKLSDFEPEFIGKLNFYVSAINELIKDESDQATIGILLCKNKDNYEVEFALKDINKPIGVSEYKYTELPEKIKAELPALDELTQELKNIENEQHNED
jgi:predicted nuclease of restriction endonuclease-like (RecB) superfamily